VPPAALGFEGVARCRSGSLMVASTFAQNRAQ
jgi:hypothetical protein